MDKPIHLLGKVTASKSPIQSDSDVAHKRVTAQMKHSVEVQQELLKTFAIYRHTLESLSHASEEVAQAIGKFAMATMTAYNYGREYQGAHPARAEFQVPDDQEHKQRQLNAALQQIVKFHTYLGQQQIGVIDTLQREFQQPVQANIEKYRDVIAVSHFDVILTTISLMISDRPGTRSTTKTAGSCSKKFDRRSRRAPGWAKCRRRAAATWTSYRRYVRSKLFQTIDLFILCRASKSCA